jgi:prepilin-type processing-associated H-X9-DG protein
MTAEPPFPEPAEVRHEKGARRVTISWQDGHVSTYAIDDLRSWCPCAVCQGHGGATKHLGLSGQSLSQIEVVGNYALCFRWGDGHDTGLYTFRYLRALCACEACGGEKR